MRYSSTWWSLLWQPARSCHTSPRRASGMPLRTKAGSCLGRTDRFICLKEERRGGRGESQAFYQRHTNFNFIQCGSFNKSSKYGTLLTPSLQAVVQLRSSAHTCLQYLLQNNVFIGPWLCLGRFIVSFMDGLGQNHDKEEEFNHPIPKIQWFTSMAVSQKVPVASPTRGAINHGLKGQSQNVRYVLIFYRKYMLLNLTMRFLLIFRPPPWD